MYSYVYCEERLSYRYSDIRLQGYILYRVTLRQIAAEQRAIGEEKREHCVQVHTCPLLAKSPEVNASSRQCILYM